MTRKTFYATLAPQSRFNIKNNMSNKHDWISPLRAIASQNYDSGHGYQVFVECYTKADWIDLVEAFETFEAAQAFVHRLARILTERHDDARAEIL